MPASLTEERCQVVGEPLLESGLHVYQTQWTLDCLVPLRVVVPHCADHQGLLFLELLELLELTDRIEQRVEWLVASPEDTNVQCGAAFLCLALSQDEWLTLEPEQLLGVRRQDSVVTFIVVVTLIQFELSERREPREQRRTWLLVHPLLQLLGFAVIGCRCPPS